MAKVFALLTIPPHPLANGPPLSMAPLSGKKNLGPGHWQGGGGGMVGTI